MDAITMKEIPAALLEHFYTLEQACYELGRSRWTIARLVEDGYLTKAKHGQAVLISKQSVAEWKRVFGEDYR
jgi:excisionase family DNA binding protein